MTKPKSLRHGRELPMSFGNSSKNYTTTKNMKKLNTKTKRMKMKASMCKTKTRVRWWEFKWSRLKSYKLQSTDPKKGKSADSNGIRVEDIKVCDDETKEMVRQIFKEIVKQNECTPGMAKSENKSDTQNRRRGRCWKRPPDLFFASVVQIVHDNIVQQIISKTWPNPGGIQKLLPNNRPSCDVQNAWSEMPRVWSPKCGPRQSTSNNSDWRIMDWLHKKKQKRSH